MFRRLVLNITEILNRWRRWREIRRCARHACHSNQKIAEANRAALQAFSDADQVVADLRKMVQEAAAERDAKIEEAQSLIRDERESFGRSLAERDSKIALLELENKGLVALNTRYREYIERDLAIFARQIEEVRTAERQPGVF
jgi:hypothetical protein